MIAPHLVAISHHRVTRIARKCGKKLVTHENRFCPKRLSRKHFREVLVMLGKGRNRLLITGSQVRSLLREPVLSKAREADFAGFFCATVPRADPFDALLVHGFE